MTFLRLYFLGSDEFRFTLFALIEIYHVTRKEYIRVKKLFFSNNTKNQKNHTLIIGTKIFNE